jgi:hypothetical protein
MGHPVPICVRSSNGTYEIVCCPEHKLRKAVGERTSRFFSCLGSKYCSGFIAVGTATTRWVVRQSLMKCGKPTSKRDRRLTSSEMTRWSHDLSALAKGTAAPPEVLETLETPPISDPVLIASKSRPPLVRGVNGNYIRRSAPSSADCAGHRNAYDRTALRPTSDSDCGW